MVRFKKIVLGLVLGLTICALMSSALAEHGQSEALLEQLAREELIENGNWLSYQRDNAPDISL